MRVRLEVAAAAAFAILACAGCGDGAGNQAQAAAQPAGEMITAVGCPVAGPQPGCVTITSRGKVYDLAGANPAVDMSQGKGISLTGRAGEATACGVMLSDIRMDYLGLQCAQAAPAAPPAT